MSNPFQRRHHRDRRRNRGIAIHQGRTEHTDEPEEGPSCVHPAQKRHQRENAAFAAIVHPQGKGDVFQRGTTISVHRINDSAPRVAAGSEWAPPVTSSTVLSV